MSPPDAPRPAIIGRVVALGPLPPALARECGALRIEPVETADALDDTMRALLVGPADPGEIRRSLAPPLHGLLEADAHGLSGIGLRCLEAVRTGGIVLSLRTGTVFDLDLPTLLGEAMVTRFGLPGDEVSERIGICLAEALGNAVLHGNLGIPDHLRTTARGFSQFRRSLHSRINDPALADRRIEITMSADANDLVLGIGDQGLGFDLDGQLRRGARHTTHCGRGLVLISRLAAGVWSDDGGRTVLMRFKR